MTRARITGFISLFLAVGLLAPSAWADIGAASLDVAGASSTPTHFDVPILVPTYATLCGVSTAEVGDPLPATLTVWVKSTDFGNTELTADRIGESDCYEFTYTPPIYACNTTIVAYFDEGLLANIDIADDGILNGSGTSACGLRFVDDMGIPIDCAVPTDASTWSVVKRCYR